VAAAAAAATHPLTRQGFFGDALVDDRARAIVPASDNLTCAGEYRAPLSVPSTAGPIYVSNAGQLGDVGETVVCAGAACHGYLSFRGRDLCAVDRDEHLIEVPFVAQPRTTTAQLIRVLLPEPVAPGPDRLIGHLDTTFEPQLPHVAEAQREPVIQPEQWLMISGGNRNPLYDEPAAVTIVDLPRLTLLAHQPDSAPAYLGRLHCWDAPDA
jgi:hypothetical protein